MKRRGRRNGRHMICEEMITKKLKQDHRDTEDRPHASKGRRHGINKKTIVVDAARGAQANQSDRVENEGAVSFFQKCPESAQGAVTRAAQRHERLGRVWTKSRRSAKAKSESSRSKGAMEKAEHRMQHERHHRHQSRTTTNSKQQVQQTHQEAQRVKETCENQRLVVPWATRKYSECGFPTFTLHFPRPITFKFVACAKGGTMNRSNSARSVCLQQAARSTCQLT